MDDPSRVLVGRLVEGDLIASFVTDSGPAAALVIEGEAGIGKSSMWGDGLTVALRHSSVVLSVRPAQAEAGMSFAGLADLFDEVADALLPALPAPQRAALEVALLRRLPDGGPPNEREIGVALLVALRVLAVDNSVLIAIDDLQWLDHASAEVLAFALRRLRAERIRALITVRTGELPGQPSACLPKAARTVLDAVTALGSQTVQLGPLTDDDVTSLVRARVGISPSTQAQRELAAVSGGNPYWALELGKAILAARPASDAGLPLPSSLMTLLSSKLDSQVQEARTALLVVAAVSRPTWGATGRALRGMVADPDAAIDAALIAGLITETAGRLRPAHPLLGSAALSTQSPGQLHRLHGSLAGIAVDPEERARHLALASDGEPDAEIARALDTGAQTARSRGATHTAADLAELAVRLTPPPHRDELARRYLAAAGLRFAAGDLTRACELAEDLTRMDPSPQYWALVLPMLVESTYWVRGQPAAQTLLRRVLETPETDPRCRAVALACAADVGDGRGTNRAELARESIALFDSCGDTDPGALSTALIYLAEDHLDAADGLAFDLLLRAEAAEARQQQAQPRSVPVLNRVRSIRGYQLKLVDDLDGARTELRHAVATARSEGDDGSLPAVLGHLALTEFWAGNYPAALAAAEEGLSHLTETGGVAPATLYASRALLAVLTGDPTLGRELITSQHLTAPANIPTKKTLVYEHVLGLAALLDGDHSQALEHLETAWAAAQAIGIHEPGRRQRLEGDLGQLLVGTGELDRATALAAEQRALGERFDRPTLWGVGARLDGLVHAARGELDIAAALLEKAVEAHRRSPLALELPRSELALGQVHRRRRAKNAARANLQSALHSFSAIGAKPWADLTRAELHRLDGARTGDTLTATEKKVATLAARGCNNREIAADLFISPRTVEGHLAAIYRKLSIRGRAELPR